MTDDSEGVHNSRETCGLYLLGALDADTESAFERHLARCSSCQDECDELGPIATALSHLQVDEVRALLGENGAVGAGSPQSSAPAQRSVARLRGANARPPTAGGPAARAGRGPVGGPEPRSRLDRPRVWSSRRRRRVGLGALVLLAVVGLGGAAAGLRWLNADAPAQVSPISVAATAEGVGASARLSVSIASHDETVNILATVAGLDPGVRYQMYAVTIDGQTHLLAEWVGVVGAQDFSDVLAVPAESLAFFSVTRQDGTAVVVARLGR